MFGDFNYWVLRYPDAADGWSRVELGLAKFYFPM